MELNQVPRMKLAYLLTEISDERLRRYIELAVLKMVALETDDTATAKSLGKIKMKNPVQELFSKYCMQFNDYMNQKSAVKLEELQKSACELRKLAQIISNIQRQVEDLMDNNLDRAVSSNNNEAVKMRFEIKYLLKSLGNLFKFAMEEISQ